MNVSIYHNPRCSKSRQTMALLEEHGADIEIIEYLKTGVDKQLLKSTLKKLGMTPREILRKKEADYAALNLSDESLSDDALIDAIVGHPKLLERPIVIAGNRAAIGRPPENVLDLLKE